MNGTKEPTVLSLLETSLKVRRTSKPRPAGWFRRRRAGLSDRLLANAIVWPGDFKGSIRQHLSHRSP
jgi:hypothetical protein